MSPPPALPRRLSLVAQTAQCLREQLRAGEWPECLPGERELGQRLQVSRHTLRAALEQLQREGLVGVSTRQRRRVLQRPALPPPEGASSRVIAALSQRPLLAMSHASMFLVDELRASLARAGFQLDIHVRPSCFAARPARALEALVERAPAAAWLIFGSHEPVQRWFVRHRLPSLTIGSSAPGIGLPSVDLHYRAACRHAGGVLRRKGHRRIAMVLPEGAHGGDADSAAGLQEAMAGLGPEAMLTLHHNGTPAHLIRVLDRALEQPRPPTAFIVARAVHVLTVLTHLQRRGCRIPQDIAVISRDDEAFLQHTTPVVARYAANPAQFAARVSTAARQLAETGALPPRALRLMPQWLPGETV